MQHDNFIQPRLSRCNVVVVVVVIIITYLDYNGVSLWRDVLFFVTASYLLYVAMAKDNGELSTQSDSDFSDHPQSGVVYISVVSVWLSDDDFRKAWRKAHPLYIQRIWVKFVYEGHRVKVKVTGAKRSNIPILAM